MTNFDIRIQVDTLLLSSDWERVIQFDEDSYGYLCFLWPLFEEAAKRTNQFVEREGDAVYGGEALGDLAKAITKAQTLLAQKPQQWEELIFTRVWPHHELIYATLSKIEMKKIVDTIETAVRRAQDNNLYITFWD